MERDHDAGDEELGPHNPDTAPGWFLRALVNIVDRIPITIPITLSVGGMFLTGELVGGKQYFQEFANQFADEFHAPLPADERESVREGFRGHGSVYEEERPAAELGGSYLGNPG